jgi:energy-coupling factor transport system ATP-binding protein
METLDHLEVTGLSCKYGSEWVLKDISFKVRKGEAVAILGRSASGKTTLAYCLSGIIPNRISGTVSGSIVADGEELIGKPIREFNKTIGIVLQNYELQIFGLTVEEDLELSLRDGDEERLEWALEFFDLKKYRDYYVHELSGGLKHRLVLASTILTNPKYVVLDDPVANLDWKSKKMVANMIKLLKENGKGVIVLGRRLKGLEGVIDKVLYLPAGATENGNIRLSDQAGLNINATSKLNDNRHIVEFNQVYYKYNSEYVLKNISLKIKRGEVLSVMGPNGSGKTTLMKHVIGLLRPCKGSVLVNGIDTRKISPARMARHVGIVFQDPEKYFVSETVRDEVAFGVRNLNLDEGLVDRALNMLGLICKKDSSPYSLSMGEKIRLSIASVIATNPEIIILDEPTTGQDDETLKQIIAIINKIKSMGKTVAIVTHDSDFALGVADRIVILNDGSIVAEGSPTQILSDPKLIDDAGIEPPSVLGEERCYTG